VIDFNKIAELLETMAVYVDDIEWNKTAEQRRTHQEKVNQLAARYTDKLGEDLDEKSIEKLSGLDSDVLDEILKVAAIASDESLEAIGGPADDSDTSDSPTNIKEAADQAEDKFLNWIIS